MAARAAILCAAMARLARGAQIVSLGSGPAGLLRAPRSNATVGASARSTTDCGSTTGTLPSLSPGAAGTYTQVGCANGNIAIPRVDFELDVRTSDNFGFCVTNGATCTQQYGDRTPCLFRGLSTGAGNWKLSQSCGGSSTCCVIVTCENIFTSCTSTASYSAFFVGTLTPGEIAGVVVGAIAGIVLLCVCVRFACGRRRRETESVVVYNAMAPQYNQPAAASYQQGAYGQPAYNTTVPQYEQAASYQQQGAYDQPYKGAQPVYMSQGGSYQGAPPPSYQQPSYQQSTGFHPPPGAQSVPTWGSVPPRA
jgi:hypothetical protein